MQDTKASRSLSGGHLKTEPRVIFMRSSRSQEQPSGGARSPGLHMKLGRLRIEEPQESSQAQTGGDAVRVYEHGTCGCAI